MNRRLSTILFIAFLVALASSYLVYRVTGNQMHGAPQKQTTSILVAVRDLPLGALIQDGDVTTGEWVGSLPKGALASKDLAVGRGVLAQVYAGEPILENRLASKGSGGGLAATIRPGMRACAVRVDDVVGVAGFVIPGMHVDVLVSGTSPGSNSNEGPKVKTLLQDIEVLSAGNDIQRDNEGKPVQVQVVNLLVTPEQAELLSLASNQTKIQLVLRNPLDRETPKTPSVIMASLLSDNAPAPKAIVAKAPVRLAAPPPPPPAVVPPPPPPQPKIYLVQVFNGSKESEQKFTDPGQK